MKQQVFIIHGGHPASSQKKYLQYLKNVTKTLDDLRFIGWKNSLQKKLGKDYEVFLPQMPNPQLAKYEEWKIWFEKFAPLLNKGVILIGHSLGGAFIAKYLAEKSFPGAIRATFLVAAPFFQKNSFKAPKTLKKLAQQGGRIYLYHSTDDPVVAFDHFEKYQKALPHAKTRIFRKKGHFHSESFPELVKDLKSL